MDIVAFGTPFGLAFASGLNAYLPLLAFTLSVRWLHLYSVNPHFAFVTHTWFMAILVILTLLDFVADKIPLIDHAWNAIHGIVLLGGLLLMREAHGILEHLLLVIAITFGTINIIGGFFVTDRMLEMFKRKPEPEESAEADE